MHPTTQLLTDARSLATFPIHEMTNILYGTPELLEIVQRGAHQLHNNPQIRNDADVHNQGRKQQILNGAYKLAAADKLFNLSDTDEWSGPLMYLQGTVFAMVSYSMSLQAIKYLGTDEQYNLWGPKFKSQEIICCYGQTEIGHGSDVQNLETTATYDLATDSFIIHTPSISATKFWPGELGFLSNHALVYARLIVDGQFFGVYPFMCQIRDVNTHKPLPGITVGDIGPKLGYQTKDNGFLAFNNFKVPRLSLLAKYNRVDDKGVFSKHGNEKVSYASMMLIRKILGLIYPRLAAQCLTIAIRYSIVRQQFTNDNGVENSVLEYQTQQDKLLPRLATVYAAIFSGLRVNGLAEENFRKVQKKNFSTMQQTHAILSGFKAWSSEQVIDISEHCRLACGGHGFAHYSGLPGVYFDCAPNVTLEGENQVLYLQVARYLLKLLGSAEKTPERVPHYFNFLKNTKQILKSTPQTYGEFMETSATLALVQVATKIQEAVKAGKSFQDVWNYDVGSKLMAASMRYIEYFNYIVFQETIAKATPGTRQVLDDLCQLYSVNQLIAFPQNLIENNKITQDQIKDLYQAKIDLMLRIKPQAVALVDAFQYTDGQLKTTIGCYDGKPYERMYDWAINNNSMNKKAVYDGPQLLKGINIKSKL